jgi:hypothetical protein
LERGVTWGYLNDDVWSEEEWVIDFENNMFISSFTEEEVKCVVFYMSVDKSPWPDGLSMFFYQFYWDTIKEDPLDMFTDFYQGNFDISLLNRAVKCLISKISEAIKNFRFFPYKPSKL